MSYLFAQASGDAPSILTDYELTELRYGRNAAAALRGTGAFLFALPINAISIAYGMLAMRKVADALGIWSQLGLEGDMAKVWTVVLIAAVVLLYAAFSGLWGVVTTDFFQLALALIGAIVVVTYALHEIGGLAVLPEKLAAAGKGDHLAFFPSVGSALLPLPTFLAYVSIQWWAYKGADGGGQFVQRLVSVPSERDAERAAWLFNIINYVIRCWPWILTALIAMLVLPGLADREMAYPLLMKRYLPAGMLGLVFASLLAAFMSSVSAQVNWGASYLVNDVYRRFVAPAASDRALVWAGRLASLLITAMASYVAFNLRSIGETFRLLIALGTGTGAVLIRALVLVAHQRVGGDRGAREQRARGGDHLRGAAAARAGVRCARDRNGGDRHGDLAHRHVAHPARERRDAQCVLCPRAPRRRVGPGSRAHRPRPAPASRERRAPRGRGGRHPARRERGNRRRSAAALACVCGRRGRRDRRRDLPAPRAHAGRGLTIVG